MAMRCLGGKIGKGVVKDGCGRGSEEESKVNILRGRVSLCDALWGSRQGIDGDGEAPTATILSAMAAGSHSTAAPRPHFDRSLDSALRTGAMRPGLSHRALPPQNNMSWASMGSI